MYTRENISTFALTYNVCWGGEVWSRLVLESFRHRRWIAVNFGQDNVVTKETKTPFHISWGWIFLLPEARCPKFKLTLKLFHRKRRRYAGMAISHSLRTKKTFDKCPGYQGCCLCHATDTYILGIIDVCLYFTVTELKKRSTSIRYCGMP